MWELPWAKSLAPSAKCPVIRPETYRAGVGYLLAAPLRPRKVSLSAHCPDTSDLRPL